MVSLEIQKKIIAKAFEKNGVPFIQSGDKFVWNGETKIKSNSSGMIYDVRIEVQLKTQKRLESQVAACLCKAEGIRFEDLLIVSMIDTRLIGSISISGLPKEDVKHNLLKFLKQVG